MSWCINCHRETKVDFNNDKGEGNKFYSIYEKYHNEIKAGTRDSVTVADIGGPGVSKMSLLVFAPVRPQLRTGVRERSSRFEMMPAL